MSTGDNFFNVAPEDVQAYATEARQFDGVWVFHHIPKTAGSSLGGELAAHARPYKNILPDYNDVNTSFSERMENAVAAFTQRANDPGQPRMRSASGHLLASHLGRIKGEVAKVRSFTFLRHPYSRIISEYSYNCSPSHPPYEEFKRVFPTLESFVRHPGEQNKQAFYLFETTDIDPAVAVSELARKYHMVGLQERYPVSFLMLSAMIWRPMLPKMRQRVGEKSEKLVVSDEMKRFILSQNQLDMALFAAVDKNMARLSPAIWSGLKPEPNP